LRRAQNEFGLRIKKIRSDNGTEFKNSQVEGFLEEEGIKHEFSSPYTPQQNGVVERKNRTLLDMARPCLMSTIHRTLLLLHQPVISSPNPQEDII
jgi:transposase InsO family protein